MILTHVENARDPEELKKLALAILAEKEWTDRALDELVQATATLTGKDYIQTMVRHFVNATHMDIAFITRILPDSPGKVQTLAYWENHKFMENNSYEVKGTPCEQVYLTRNDVCIDEALLENFPKTSGKMKIYIGIPLFDSRRQIFGHFAIMHHEQLNSIQNIHNLARIFSSRVATEMERHETQEALQQKNQELENTLELLKEMQKQVIQQEKLASLGNLTAGIAHEIKNPLNFVNNFSHISRDMLQEFVEILVSEQGSLNTEAQEIYNDLVMNLELIEKHGKRADAIVQRMQAHTRGQETQPEGVNINRLLEDSVNLAFHSQRAKDPGFNIELKYDLAPDIREVIASPLSLDRAVRNIVENAFIAVTLKKNRDTAFQPVVSISTRQLVDSVQIVIEDNGMGIKEENIELIFDPFFTTKPTLTSIGLGLSTAYDIICIEHEGQLKVESHENEFTRFVIEINQ